MRSSEFHFHNFQNFIKRCASVARVARWCTGWKGRGKREGGVGKGDAADCVCVFVWAEARTGGWGGMGKRGPGVVPLERRECFPRPVHATLSAAPPRPPPDGRQRAHRRVRAHSVSTCAGPGLWQAGGLGQVGLEGHDPLRWRGRVHRTTEGGECARVSVLCVCLSLDGMRLLSSELCVSGLCCPAWAVGCGVRSLASVPCNLKRARMCLTLLHMTWDVFAVSLYVLVSVGWLVRDVAVYA